ncbi:tyrosine-type recombinase/integrase [Photobacterium sp. GSS17]|uniref:tyrosine-type recombinase/integrase n=1 Tax=Photobacterium sp. GSS17 TaxID=3020715 RepID=UPI00235FC68E|nr:tyrosine-type recombinase/integrase [Photobacterium sp. GSS17]
MANAVQPVRDPKQVREVERRLKRHYGKQFAQMWVFGINTALRVSDVLTIRPHDVKNGILYVNEKKTKKSHRIVLNKAALAIYQEILKEYPDTEYLFQSRGNRGKGSGKPLARQSVWKAFEEIGQMLDIKLGTHSMRKTRGYHMYKKTLDIARVQKMLNHSSPATTMAYIGLDQDQIDDDFLSLVL